MEVIGAAGCVGIEGGGWLAGFFCDLIYLARDNMVDASRGQ
jgi:hypothetical protein